MMAIPQSVRDDWIATWREHYRVEPLSEWVERRRVVVGGNRPGPWNPANAVQAIEPMDAFMDSRVRQISIQAPAQLLKSEFSINVAVYSAAQGDDVLFYEPDERLLGEFVSERIRPALLAMDVPATFTDAPTVTRALKKRDSATMIRIDGAGAITGLTPSLRTGKSSRAAPIVIIDEIDKMGDPSMVGAALTRTASYGPAGRVVSVSTPTTEAPGSIAYLWAAGSRGQWNGRCSHCGELVLLNWSLVQFKTDESGYWQADTAFVACSACGATWTEADRLAAIRAGRYVHERPDNPHKSYWIHGVAHPWRSLREIIEHGARAYREAIEGDVWEGYRQYVNEWRAEPWTDEYEGLSARGLAIARYDLGGAPAPVDGAPAALGTLDRRVLLVTAGADVSADTIFAEFVAWGIDEYDRLLSWGLQYCEGGGGPGDSIEKSELWRDFERLVTDSVWIHSANGAPVRVQKVLIDEGYRPEIIRGWCEEFCEHEPRFRGRRFGFYEPRIVPSKGLAVEGSSLIPVTMTLPKKGTANYLRAAPHTVFLRTTELKDMVYDGFLSDRRLPAGRPPAHQWPAGHGYDDEYMTALSSEVRTLRYNARGKVDIRWRQKTSRKAKFNEPWDCRVYALAAAYVLINEHIRSKFHQPVALLDWMKQERDRSKQ